MDDVVVSDGRAVGAGLDGHPGGSFTSAMWYAPTGDD